MSFKVENGKVRIAYRQGKDRDSMLEFAYDSEKCHQR